MLGVPPLGGGYRTINYTGFARTKSVGIIAGLAGPQKYT